MKTLLSHIRKVGYKGFDPQTYKKKKKEKKKVFVLLCKSTGFTTPNSKHCMVYDILPSTTAVFSYAIGPRKVSANEQFFVGAQTVVSLLQTTQIISDVCFMLPCCLRQFR